MPLVSVSVSVPEEDVGQLLRYAAALADGDSVEPDGDYEDEESGDRPQRARRGTGARRVREVYLGGTSEHWRPFLEHLAEQPDQWVPWSELCDAIDLAPGSAAGMLGAAERRCGRVLPYEKRWNGSERVFRMPANAAEVVCQLAEGSGYEE